jgi:hypothetical protein
MSLHWFLISALLHPLNPAGIDTVRLGCDRGTPLSVAALDGAYTLRTSLANGEVMETSVHMIVTRDTMVEGRSATLFQGDWQHTSGRVASERVLFCKAGTAPISLTNTGRLGTISEIFAGNTVTRQSPSGSSIDTLPATPFPYAAFHVIALLAAAGPDGESIVPLYRDEEESRGSRFQWARVEARTITGVPAPLREVVIHAFGGSTHFFFDLHPLRLITVQLTLGSGDTIEEVRR